MNYIEDDDIMRMWEINTRLTLGYKINKNDREFYNNNYINMLSEMKDNYTYWKHTIKKIKND